jgi:hypothetical protein
MHHAMPDRTRVVLKTMPASGLRPLSTMLVVAPVELPCPNGAIDGRCSREYALAQERKAYGAGATLIPLGLLALCNRTLAQYDLPPGPMTSVSTTCTRQLRNGGTIYGVGGHMHLRGREIRIELVRRGARPQMLLHIPKWDFHWQDIYELAKPIRAHDGDGIRVTCTHDNSAAAQPMLGRKPIPPRYVLWGEGTTDEMCLAVLSIAYRQ